jgi:sodium-dependent dicarboxylate transporter 2/3/5
MYPIILAITPLFAGSDRDARNTRTALLLGMAYASSIGGMGTLLGTPPNLILAGAAKELAGQEVSFLSFLAFGVPLEWLADPANIEERSRSIRPEGPQVPVYYFKPYAGQVIWGATARITLSLLELIRTPSDG